MAEYQLDSRVQLRDPAKQKRKYGRVEVRVPAEFHLEKGTVRYEASLLNVGTGGVGLTARIPLNPGDRIQLSFPLDEDTVDSWLVVSRSNGNSFGAIFENPEDPAISTVQGFIEKKFFNR